MIERGKRMIKKRIEGLFCQESSVFLLKFSVWERCISGHIVFLGIRHLILTDQGKDKPFFRVSQRLLNGKLLQSIAADRTVCYGGLYGLP